MAFRINLRIAGILALQALCLPLCNATLDTYTTQASFNSAVSSGYQPLSVANFDDLAPGVYPSPSILDGVSVAYTPYGGGAQLEVTNAFVTTSGFNSLGATDGDSFVNGDSLTFTFAHPEQAAGLFVITAGSNSLGDFMLSATPGSVGDSGVVDPAFASLPGSWVYFLGLVETDPTMAFSSVTLSNGSVAPGSFVFNVDDVVATSATPSGGGGGGGGSAPDEASTLCLLVGACTGLLPLLRRRA